MTPAGKLYLFRSATKEGLRAFAASSGGDGLPKKLGPWTGIGIVRSDQAAPHGLSRNAIEEGIAANGFQLFRNKKA